LTGWGGVIAVAIAIALVLKTFIIGAIRVPSASMENTLLPGDLVLIDKLVYGSTASGKLPFSESGFPDFRIPGLRSVGRGDVIVFRFPEEGNETRRPVYFVKRCIALGGDKVEVRRGVCYVNDDPVRLPEGVRPPSSRDIEDFGPIFVPAKGDSLRLTKLNYAKWEDVIRQEGHDVECDPVRGVLIDGNPAKSYRIEKSYLFVMGDNAAHSYDSRSWGYLPEENVIGEAMVVYWSQRPAQEEDHPSGLASVRWGRIGNLVR
jgi:signal peptidase I